MNDENQLFFINLGIPNDVLKYFLVLPGSYMAHSAS